MIKGMQTVDQYKIMQHIQKNFVISEIEYELVDRNAIKITDINHDSIIFKLVNGEIIEEYDQEEK